MKQEIANWLFLIGTLTLTISVIIKFVLWLGLKSPRRIGFIKSFAVWFSQNDIHDASSRRSRNFLYWNNVLNMMIWTSAGILLTGFVLDTDSVVPTMDPRMRR